MEHVRTALTAVILVYVTSLLVNDGDDIFNLAHLLGNFVFLSALMSFGSGLIMPMKKPSGDPDMDSVINHVTLMEQTMAGLQTQVTDLTTLKSNLQTAEQTITSLQTQVQASNKDLRTVKSKLQTAEQSIISFQNQAQTSNTELSTLKGIQQKNEEKLKASKDEITAVKAELRLAETDIAFLKHDLQTNPDPMEFTQLKTDFEALKASHNALVQQVNFTVIDAVSADVKSNTRDIQSLKSGLVKTESEVNKTSFDIMLTRADVANLTTEVPIMKEELNQSIQDAVSTKADIAVLKSQLTDVNKSINTTTNNIHSLEAQVTFAETEYNVFRYRQNINEHDAVNNKANIVILKTQLTEVSKFINTSSTNISSLETRLTSAETQYNSVRSRQNITEHEVAECNALAQSTAADLKTAHTQVQTVQTAVQTVKSQVQTVQTQVNTVSTDVHGLRGELTAIRTKTNKDVAFQVTQRGPGHAGWTTLKFDTVDYNTGNGYKTTGVFTAPTSGTYIFWASVAFDSPVGYNYIYIHQGSQTLAVGVCYVETPGHYCGVYPTVTTHLDVGDQVGFTTNNPSSYIAGANYSSYGGALLHVS